jgi:hypothetical protein
VFSAVNVGGGLIRMVVTNSFPYAVDAFLTWSWGGVTGQSSDFIGARGATTLQVQLPAGFDATLEISAQTSE